MLYMQQHFSLTAIFFLILIYTKMGVCFSWWVTSTYSSALCGSPQEIFIDWMEKKTNKIKLPNAVHELTIFILSWIFFFKLLPSLEYQILYLFYMPTFYFHSPSQIFIQKSLHLAVFWVSPSSTNSYGIMLFIYYVIIGDFYII